MNEQLIKWSREGYAPDLIYDDDGRWAIKFSSFFLNELLLWRDTPQEAVDAAIGHEENL